MSLSLKNVSIIGDEAKASQFIENLKGKNPVFICTIANTKTAMVPGITVAGAAPEIVKCTPPADAELVYYGECKCISGIPATPDGKPTPAIITLSALRLANIPFFIVEAGCEVKPYAPYISLNISSPGDNIQNGRALDRDVVEKAMNYAEIIGRNFAELADYLVLGESIPAGTTTALGVLMSLGIDARGKVSSSMPDNPHEIKNKVVEDGMKAAGIKIGSLKDDPIGAISTLGDPMMVSVVGMALGAAQKVPVILAGGTQMAAIVALISRIRPTILRNIAVGTTNYIIEDSTSSIGWLIDQSANIPIFGADPGLSESKKEGLRAYGSGFVREGVGAGGATLAAMLKSKGKITTDVIRAEIDRNYEKIVESRLKKH
ncbi:MAG: nicotinate mononucleotide-dependent phosphoribosyltransferase CobT [Nitrososphaerales archaeon]